MPSVTRDLQTKATGRSLKLGQNDRNQTEGTLPRALCGTGGALTQPQGVSCRVPGLLAQEPVGGKAGKPKGGGYRGHRKGGGGSRLPHPAQGSLGPSVSTD